MTQENGEHQVSIKSIAYAIRLFATVILYTNIFKEAPEPQEKKEISDHEACRDCPVNFIDVSVS